MSLADLMKKGSLRGFATATAATAATHWQEIRATVATVATVAVAETQKLAANHPAPEPPTDPDDWRELAAAYYAHHLNCSTCIAAGHGAVYGERCDVGALLWSCYQNIEGKK